MESIKCYICKRTQPKSEFHTFKSCQTCRKKKATKKEPVSVPIETFSNVIVESKNVVEPLKIVDMINVSINDSINISWINLSGKWIKRGEEKALHQKLMKRLNRQYLSRCAFPVHKYLTKNIMKDIEDI
jgi:hypothetical protein